LADVPHFDLPFRFEGTQSAVVEQDSDADILNCVNAAVRTTRGTRFYAANFGIDDPTFENQPINMTEILTQVRESEPRAQLNGKQFEDFLEANLTIGVGGVS
jgi:hypothetical protein